jgi:hypothetical protein
MSRLKRFTRRRGIVVTIALGSEVDELFFAALATLDHLLLTRPIRTSNFIAGHFTFLSHYYLSLNFPEYFPECL